MKEMIDLLSTPAPREASGVRRLAAALASDHKRAPQTPRHQRPFDRLLALIGTQIHPSKNPSIHSSSVSSVNSVPSVLNNTEPRTVNPEPRTATPEPFADTFDDLHLQLEHAQSLAEHSPDVFLKASMNIAAVELFSVLNRFDSVTLSKRLEEKPELYFQLLNSQFNLAKAHLDQQKFEFRKEQAKARQRERDQKLRARKPILITPDTLATLSDALACSRRREEADRVSPPPNVAPASSIQGPASSSSVSSVNSASSVLKDESKPSVTANTGPTDFVDFKPAQHSQLAFDDESVTSEHAEPQFTNSERWPQSVCCDVKRTSWLAAQKTELQVT